MGSFLPPRDFVTLSSSSKELQNYLTGVYIPKSIRNETGNQIKNNKANEIAYLI
jgi:hypothetical protein